MKLKDVKPGQYFAYLHEIVKAPAKQQLVILQKLEDLASVTPPIKGRCHASSHGTLWNIEEETEVVICDGLK